MLECIDEEESNQSGRSSEDHSAHTTDPRYFSKKEYMTTLTQSHSYNDPRPKYSILAKKVSNDDIYDMTEKRVKKAKRGGNPQQKKGLVIDKRISRKFYPDSTFYFPLLSN